MRDSLARMLPREPADEAHLRDMRAAAWHRQNIAVIRLDDIANDFDRQHVINIANRLYGKRKDPA